MFILGAIAIGMQIFTKADENNQVSVNGLNVLRYFTNDGNIFILITSLITGIYFIYSIIKNKEGVPRWIYLLNLMSASSGVLIFVTVVFILFPYFGPVLLQGYLMIILHAINPLLALVLFLLCTKGKIEKKISYLGMLPMAIYGIISLLLCITKVWTGDLIPYPFLRVYENPVWMSILYVVGMFSGTGLLSFGLAMASPYCYLEGKEQKKTILSLGIVLAAFLVLGIVLIILAFM
jgi:hypothetical protein